MKKQITIALAGNPNAGKSTVFNALTGARQHIANYPGVTVEKKTGKVIHGDVEIEVVDLPGTYSLTAYSLEELVARNFIIDERPDLVLDIVDASNLDRHLYLAVQLRELGVPLVLVLNMVDVAEARGIQVDAEALSRTFGLPVVPTVARTGKGIKDLIDKIVHLAGERPSWEAPAITYGMDIDRALDEISAIIEQSEIYDPKYPSRWRALKCLEGDHQIKGLLGRDPALGEKIEVICDSIHRHTLSTLEEEPEAIIADHRYGYIAGIVKQAVKARIDSRLYASDKIDKVLTNRILGPVVMMLVLYGIYVFTFWASESFLLWFDVLFAFLREKVSILVPEGNLQSLLVSGIIDGVGGVIGFVPLIMFMFFSIAVLEDSGYMARVAYMLDRVLRWFGLHGNSVMALVVSGGISGGCAVPGVLATRVLKDPRERIATLLVAPFMNCGAKLPVYAMLISAFFAKDQARMLFILTLLSWAFALLSAKLIRSTVLRGPKTPFVMELPPYRAPTLKGLLIHTWERTWEYIKRAGTIILAFSIILWAMMTFPGPSAEEKAWFEGQREATVEAFLHHPEIRNLVQDRGALQRMDDLYKALEQEEANPKTSPSQESDWGQVVLTALELKDIPVEARTEPSEARTAALRYLAFREERDLLNAREQEMALKGAIAGWLGQKLEWITEPLGFDYRTNIALVGGFAAKEVVVSTLGTAYSLGETDPEASGSLSQRLREDPRWDPLQAFVFLIFTMLYVPCIATVISIRRESSWGWAGFSILYNLLLAYGVALLIRQAGRLLVGM